MLESFYSARQQFREEEACEAALAARNLSAVTEANYGDSLEASEMAKAAELPLDPILEEMTHDCVSQEALRARLRGFFDWFVSI